MALSKPLSSRIDSLPKILAGPILRRVEASSVTVWFASRVSFAQVTLKIFGPNGTTQVGSGTVKTDKIGDNLHIGLITATATSALTPGNTYFYSLSFDGSALDAAGMLTAAGGSAALALISYSAAGALPSFSLPPNQVDQLCILHGSCRKPHAESLDGMQIADQIISQSAGDPLARPHQLFFTGDQIYADDVGISLLAILTDVGNTLLGTTGDKAESIPGLSEIPGPDERQKTATDELGFTSTEAGCHLFTFAEFCAMYLLSCSDVLWPSDLPAFSEIFGDESQVHDLTLGLKLITFDTARASKFKQQNAWLVSFKASLPRVRRALANVATYMICDDHEITDDWYMNRDWAEQVFSKPAGRRVIQNGLAAYLLFQGSGNDPGYFRAQPAFNAFVKGVADWVSIGFKDGTALDAIGAALPVPKAPLGTADVIRPDRPLRFHFAIGWGAHRVLALDTRTWRRYPQSDTVDAVLISDVGLDTEATDFASSLSAAPNLASGGVYFVIAPSPVLNIPYMDHVIENGVFLPTLFERLFGATDKSLAFDRDREILRLSAPAYDGLLGRVSGLADDGVGVVLLSGDVHYGFAGQLEHWQIGSTASRKGFVQLTSSAFKNQSSSLLNLATTAHLQYWGFHEFIPSDSVPDPELRLTWQMTAAETAASERRLRIGDAKIFGTINVGGSYARKDNSLAVVRNVDDSTTFYESVKVTRPPDFITRTRMIASSGGTSTPSTPRVVETPSTSTQGKLQDHLDAASDHNDVFVQAKSGQQAVGFNNLARVTLKSNPSTVIQELWWWLAKPTALLQAQASDDPNHPLTGDLAPHPYSVQTVPLPIGDPPDTSVLK